MPVKKHPVVRSRPSVPTWKPEKTALITGASGGIGYDLSSIFAQNGYDVVLVARSRDKLLALANQARKMFGVSAKVIAKDLSRPGAADEIVRELKREGIEISVLVNNAGYAAAGTYVSTSLEDELGLIQVNVATLAHLTKLLLPSMLKRGYGKILNIGSSSGFQPGPLMANYSATKSYVLNFSVALAEELREKGITISVLCPGPTFSGFQERAGIAENPRAKRFLADSRIIARAGFEGLMAGKEVIVPGFFNKMGVLISRVLPRSVAGRLIKRFREPTLKTRLTKPS